MHHEQHTNSPHAYSSYGSSYVPSPSDHHGFLDHHSSLGSDEPPAPAAGDDGQRRGSPILPLSSRSSFSCDSNDSSNSSRIIDACRFDQLLPALRGTHQAGQRVIDCENASLSGSRVDARSSSVLGDSARFMSLDIFPNEILINIISYIDSNSLPNVATLSKRFYNLVTSPPAWRLAFSRAFPGQDTCPCGRLADHSSDPVRSEARFFGRLTANATWRSEYMLRVRLLRSLANGIPGRGARANADRSVGGVLTYGTKSGAAITHLDAKFCKKNARTVHGSASIGTCTASDPTCGKLDNWGTIDSFSIRNLGLNGEQNMYGLGDGSASMPNVMDLCTDYGFVVGAGFPGCVVYYRSSNDRHGFFLNRGDFSDSNVPAIPHSLEAISSVWIAKSPAVPNATDSVVGILTGSTLGVVTAYSLGSERSASRFSKGEMSARWVVCPGVPIIGIKIDDSYSSSRKKARRVWAVILNALGELYYLAQVPKRAHEPVRGNITKNAWLTGHSVEWTLVEATRRRERPDDLHCDASGTLGKQKSPSRVCQKDKSEDNLRQLPSYFRNTFDGWDMRRILEVDFGGDDGRGGGEAVFVMDSGHLPGGARVHRYTRQVPGLMDGSGSSGTRTWGISRSSTQPFGIVPTTEAALPRSATVTTIATSQSLTKTTQGADFWRSVSLKLDNDTCAITASALDSSNGANQTLMEAAAQRDIDVGSATTAGITLGMHDVAASIPGYRARMLAIGFNNGSILVWDARATVSNPRLGLAPLRVIQTDSPEISCLAVSALYVVHGGSDGLSQAWDPLASTLNPIKKLNARSSSSQPRSTAIPAVGALYLDPDPTILRGIVAIGPIIKSWSYSTGDCFRFHKLRPGCGRSGVQGRRHDSAIERHIRTEAHELLCEKQAKEKDMARLRNRFGIGLGDLTEDEALAYAKMMSEESFAAEEMRRCSSTASSSQQSLLDTTVTANATPASRSSLSTPAQTVDDTDGEYELQLQRAMRLSLLDTDPSAELDSVGREYSIRSSPRTPRKNKKNKSPLCSSSPMEVCLAERDEEFEQQIQRAMALSLEPNGRTLVEDTLGLGISIDAGDSGSSCRKDQ